MNSRDGSPNRIACAGRAAFRLAVTAQRARARRGFGMQQERKIVAQFDKNGDRRLDKRRAQGGARVPREQPAGGFGGRAAGGFGRRPRRPAGAGTEGHAGRGEDLPGRSALRPGTLRTLFLEFEDDDWEHELAAFNNTDVEVPATLTVDGKTYPDVGVHFRGASSYFMVPEGRKRSLNLSMDFVRQQAERSTATRR